MEKAAVLTETRGKAAFLLENKLKGKVSPLGMPNMNFKCRVETGREPGPRGTDDVVFLFSSNKNVPMQAISAIASGGEISRLMLGLKSLIAGALSLPTVIFDEIDTGVSGDIADRMGQIMREMGERMQVVAITHLPQIAARGQSHYFVYKKDTENATETCIRKLSERERVEEIAHMLSGAHITKAAIENAKALLNLSGNYLKH